jgi:hypothetical protein
MYMKQSPQIFVKICPKTFRPKMNFIKRPPGVAVNAATCDGACPNLFLSENEKFENEKFNVRTSFCPKMKNSMSEPLFVRKWKIRCLDGRMLFRKRPKGLKKNIAQPIQSQI